MGVFVFSDTMKGPRKPAAKGASLACAHERKKTCACVNEERDQIFFTWVTVKTLFFLHG